MFVWKDGKILRFPHKNFPVSGMKAWPSLRVRCSGNPQSIELERREDLSETT
jgi:hypothetical protein